MKVINLIKSLAICCSVACMVIGSAYATNDTEKRVEKGSRSMTVQEDIKLREDRSQQSEDKEQKESTSSEKLEPKGLSYREYAGVNHWATMISVLGGVVEIEGGTRWLVSYYDAYKTINWCLTDIIIIKPNSSFFSIYGYQLYNLTTGQKIEANLLDGPYYASPYRLSIIGIDYLLDEIILSDGTSWSISRFDSIGRWICGDSVVVGVNNSIINPYILININVNTYVRASID